MLLLVRYGVGGFVFRQGLSMYLSFGGDCRVEIGGALLVGSVVKGTFFCSQCAFSRPARWPEVLSLRAFVSPELFVAECCLSR